MIESSSSRFLAKNRLNKVIYSDRTDKIINNNTVELIKYDIFKAVSKYININEDSVKITFDDCRSDNSKSSIKLNATIDLGNICNR